jgi:hypothetical protein
VFATDARRITPARYLTGPFKSQGMLQALTLVPKGRKTITPTRAWSRVVAAG